MIVTSPQELANAVNDQMRLGLTRRRWNLYKPRETFWGLVPSTEWPAYRHGKLAFSSASDHPRKGLL